MPSLRRAFSSPSVRASPYPALPSSRSHHSHHRPHRRSSGSDVSDRKVLADIDWWRVADGQREHGGAEEDEAEEDEEERDVGEENAAAEAAASAIVDHAAVPGGAPSTAVSERPAPATDRGGESAGVELERPSTPVASDSPLLGHDRTAVPGYSSQFHLFGQLASFAAGPRTPTRRTVSESSTSSLESTPEVLRTPIERLSFDGMGFADPGSDVSFFHMRLTSLSPVTLAPKRVFPRQGGLYDDEHHDGDLADPLMSHDDLFA